MDVKQRLLVQKHLSTGMRLTSFEAFELYGITRLSAVIYDLRKNGLDIDDCWVYGVNRYGRPVKYKSYFVKRKSK